MILDGVNSLIFDNLIGVDLLIYIIYMLKMDIFLIIVNWKRGIKNFRYKKIGIF
jgi:hypothetical protein